MPGLSLGLGLGLSNTPGKGGGVRKILFVGGPAQSPLSGRGLNNQVFVSSGAGAKLYGNDNVLRELADPWDDSAGQVDTVSSDPTAAGSPIPLMATRLLEANPGIALEFVPAAKGGTKISDWLPNASNPLSRSTLFGSMMTRALSRGAGQQGVVTIFLGRIGTTDAGAGTTQASFAADFATVAAKISELVPNSTLVLATLESFVDANAQAGKPAIDAAITSLWGTGNIVEGPTLTPIFTDAADPLHELVDIKISVEADKWIEPIQRAISLIKAQSIGIVSSDNYLPKPDKPHAWTMARVSPTINQAANPFDGEITADLFTTDGVAGTKALSTLPHAVTAGERRLYTFYLKPGTARYFQVYGTTAAFGSVYANFDIVSVVVGTMSGVERFTEAMPDDHATGWVRIEVLMNVVADHAAAVVVLNCVAAANASRGATGADNVTYYLAGAGCYLRNSAPPYVQPPNRDAGLDADAILLLDRMDADLTDEQRQHVNTIVLADKAAGLWTAGLIWRPRSFDPQAGLLCWNNPSYDATVSGSPTFAAGLGFKGDGVSAYLNLNVTWDTIPFGFGQNAGTIAWEETDNVADSSFAIGLLGSDRVLGRARSASDTAAARVNASANSAPTNTDARKLICAVRTGATSTDTYINGVFAANSASAAAAPTATGVALLRSQTTYSTRRVGFAFLGGAISAQQVADMYAINAAWASGPLAG